MRTIDGDTEPAVAMFDTRIQPCARCGIKRTTNGDSGESYCQPCGAVMRRDQPAPDWTKAACVGKWVLFDLAGEPGRTPAIKEATRQAHAICMSCPLLDVCGDWIRQTEPRTPADRAGFWAGTRPHERRLAVKGARRGSEEAA